MIPLIQMIMPLETPLRGAEVQPDCAAPFVTILEGIDAAMAQTVPGFQTVAAPVSDRAKPDAATGDLPPEPVVNTLEPRLVGQGSAEFVPPVDPAATDLDPIDRAHVMPIGGEGIVVAPQPVGRAIPTPSNDDFDLTPDDGPTVALADAMPSNFGPAVFPTSATKEPVKSPGGASVPSLDPAMPDDPPPISRHAIEPLPVGESVKDTSGGGGRALQPVAHKPVKVDDEPRPIPDPIPDARSVAMPPQLPIARVMPDRPSGNVDEGVNPAALPPGGQGGAASPADVWSTKGLDRVPPIVMVPGALPENPQSFAGTAPFAATVDPSTIGWPRNAPSGPDQTVPRSDAIRDGLAPESAPLTHPETPDFATADRAVQPAVAPTDTRPDAADPRRIDDRSPQSVPAARVMPSGFSMPEGAERGIGATGLLNPLPAPPSPVNLPQSQRGPYIGPAAVSPDATVIEHDAALSADAGTKQLNPVPPTPQIKAVKLPQVPVSAMLETDLSTGPDDVDSVPIAFAHPVTALHPQPLAAHHAVASLPPTVAADLLHLAHARPDAPVDLTLNPEELGRLRFEMTQSGDAIRVVLTVERLDTLDLLRRNADQLMSEFRQAGFTGATLSFGQWGQGSADHPAPRSPQPGATVADAGVVDAGFTQPSAHRGSSGLDLRL